MNRVIFMECLFRIAIYIYADRRVINRQLKPVGQQNFEEVTNSRALNLFIDICLKPFHEQRHLDHQKFRDEELWQVPVNIVLSNNEKGLKEVFNKYCRNIKELRFMSQADCIKLIIKDAGINVNEKQVLHDFALSKMTVVNELDDLHFYSYNRMVFEEFCEFIARVIVTLLKDSELEELPLEEKLEYILEVVLPLAGHTFKPNKIIIEEFSESDEDY